MSFGGTKPPQVLPVRKQSSQHVGGMAFATMSDHKMFRRGSIGMVVAILLIGIMIIVIVISDRPVIDHTPYAGPSGITPVTTSVPAPR